MAGRQAKTLAPLQQNLLLQHVRGRRDALRSRVIILLSFRAGLRACEMARVEWPMLLDSAGRVAHSIELEDRIAKKKSGRRIPIHPELRAALNALLRRTPNPVGPVIRSRKGGHMRPNSIVNWFVQLFVEVELAGCSSHSGRRTFITVSARNLHEAGGSLRDVQLLVGHKSLLTTQAYIEGSSNAQRKLVSLL
jgi:integrase/recombinase XerD